MLSILIFIFDVKDRLLKANHNNLTTAWTTDCDVKDRLLKANHNLVDGDGQEDDVKDRLLKANHNFISF